MQADALLILTDVDAVYAGYGTPRQRRLAEMSATEARTLLGDREFGVGSMGPKVDAAASFAAATGKSAFIARLQDGTLALSEGAGTRIRPDRHPVRGDRAA